MGKSNLKYLKMAKSKNHTSHNQGYKNHRNGIYRPKQQKYVSNAMVNQKLIRNTRRAKKFDPSIKKQVNLTKKIAKLKSCLDNKRMGIKPKRAAPKQFRK